eukprot:TRINITY_DN3184_c0_g1_i2.p1 TRINITY_DN3184_c0_g1~~TRINITY_DN3184_c0_g1_i2.p1  ORF type:complete len:149 (+),score=36.85 TRINITY_DN3184_c0_g1_i2:61-447(+)
MRDLNDFIVQNRDSMEEWVYAVSRDGGNEEATGRYNGEETNKVVVSEGVKIRCIKWMLGQVYANRQVVRRELTKKLGMEEWKQIQIELEAIGVLKGVTESGTATLTDLTSRELLGRGKSPRPNDETMS